MMQGYDVEILENDAAACGYDVAAQCANVALPASHFC
jgi:hypothetical protein